MPIHLPDIYLALGVLAAAFVGKWLLYLMHGSGKFNWAYAKPAFWGALLAIFGGSLVLPQIAPDTPIEGRLLAGAITGWALVGGPNTREISKWLTKLFTPETGEGYEP